MNPNNQPAAFVLVLTALQNSYLPTLKPKEREHFDRIMKGTIRSAHVLMDLRELTPEYRKETGAMKVLKKAMEYCYGEDATGAVEIPKCARPEGYPKHKKTKKQPRLHRGRAPLKRAATTQVHSKLPRIL